MNRRKLNTREKRAMRNEVYFWVETNLNYDFNRDDIDTKEVIKLSRGRYPIIIDQYGIGTGHCISDFISDLITDEYTDEEVDELFLWAYSYFEGYTVNLDENREDNILPYKDDTPFKNMVKWLETE